eukprot:gene32816-42482_t
MNKLGEEDDSNVADTMDRGVTIAFLVKFCTFFSLWDVSIEDTRRKYIVPMTSEKRCRFVDLPILKEDKETEVVGRADTYILCTRQSKFGDLVTSISDGADPKRKVWLDLFASRQWPCSKTDFFIEYAIQHCPSFLVFCPDPAELVNCSDVSALPAAVKAKVPFFRLWCLYQIYFAAICSGVSIVVRCGRHELVDDGKNGISEQFKHSSKILTDLVGFMDNNNMFQLASVTFAADMESLEKKLVDLDSDPAKMNIKLRSIVRAAVETSGDTILHNAACGDEIAKNQVLYRPRDYVHKIAIAGYIKLLVMVLTRRPDLVEYVDTSTKRSLLIHAAWGGSSKCVRYLVKQGASLAPKDINGKTALEYAKEFKHSDCEEDLGRKVPKSFYIKHVKTQLYVGPRQSDKRYVKLVLQKFNITAPLLFRFDGDQLKHVNSGNYVHPFGGRKGADVNIGLQFDSDGERTSCYQFDYDPKCCLLFGGNNFFVKINRNRELVWHSYWNTNDEKSPFKPENGFEFELEPYESEVKQASVTDNAVNMKQAKQEVKGEKETDKKTVMDYHRVCESGQMDSKIREFLFPRSYLVESVDEWAPYNGKIKHNNLEGVKTIASDSITQRMLLITANITTFDFTFGKHKSLFRVEEPLSNSETGSTSNGLAQLTSFRLNESEIISNSIDEVYKDLECLSIHLHENHQFFDSIRVQCVLSLQNNPSNVKHICYLEVTAKNSTAKLGDELHPNKDGKWSIGTKRTPGKETIGNIKVCIFDVEEVEGPLVFTGVGIDSYSGFVFQIAHIFSEPSSNTSKNVDSEMSRAIAQILIDECFYEDDPRLTSADITHYNYFESVSKAQTGYKEIGQFSTHTVRNLFRELAVEDKQVAILFQKLNYFYPEFTTNPVSKVLPTMLDILERCFADNQISLIQSVIRVSHIKSDESMINPPVREIWSTFTSTISMVKQFILKRPKLNMIECAILSDSLWGKIGAILVATSQCLIAYILSLHVLSPQSTIGAEVIQCDVLSVINEFRSQQNWSDQCNCILKCYWRVDFSFMMTIIAVIMSVIKVKSQMQDQYKFYTIFKPLVMEKTGVLSIVLLLLDCTVNVVLSVITVFLTFFLISLSDEATDLVLNCLAITFIVELDEDLNDRDPIEVNDLVIQSFKKYLINDIVRKDQEISNRHNISQSASTGDSTTSWIDRIRGILPFIRSSSSKENTVSQQDVRNLDATYLHIKIIGANYSSDMKSEVMNTTVFNIVKECIERGKLLPVLNDRFRGDPDSGKAKFLVLQLEGGVVLNVREKLVVDFSVVEQMLKEKHGLKVCSPNNLNCPINSAFYHRLQWFMWVVGSVVFIAGVMFFLLGIFMPFLNGFLVAENWRPEIKGTVVTLTWPYNHVSISKEQVDAEVSNYFGSSPGNHTTVQSVYVVISGQKNSLDLMAEFGLLPAVAAWNQTATHQSGRPDVFKGDEICANAAMILSDKLWFDSIADSQNKPYKFAGGCILPPNKLAIQYVASQSLADKDEKSGDAADQGECTTDSGGEIKTSLH